MKRVSAFRQAITAADNVTIDPTFVCVLYAVFGLGSASVLAMIALSFVDVIVNHHDASPGALGGGIGGMLAGLGAFIASMVALLWQDRKPQAPQMTTTQTTTTTASVATPVVAATEPAHAS